MDYILGCFCVGLILIFICYCILTDRNDHVHKSRMSMLKRIGELADERVNKRREWIYLYDFWDSFITHNTMCSRFWAPIAKYEELFDFELLGVINSHKN